MFTIQLYIVIILYVAAVQSAVIEKSEVTLNEFYIETEEKVNWYQAWNNCSSRHMSLVTLDTKVKTEALEKELRKVYGSDHPNIWIGGNDNLKTHHFMWPDTNQAFSYKNWAPGQPDNKWGKEHCVFLWEYHNYRWNDGDCSSKMAYVCEGSQIKQ